MSRPRPSLVAALDQAQCDFEAHAKIFAAYLHALVARGLSREEALDLTIAAQSSFLEAVLRDEPTP